MVDWKENVRTLLERNGLHMKEASLNAGKGETFVRDLLKRDRVPSVENLQALAGVLKVTVSEILGEESTSSVPLVGLAGAGPDGTVAFSDAQGQFGEAALPPGGTLKTVALGVRGDSMRGIADDGALIYYDDRRDPPTADLLGQLCVVGLPDGRVLVKYLSPGSKRHTFTLTSVAAPDMMDVRIEWAALVTAIIPPRAAQRLILKGAA